MSMPALSNRDQQGSSTIQLPVRLSWPAVMAMVLAMLVLMQFSSAGFVSRPGTGTDEDSGSGLGGTGRAQHPGTGLGGTGLKPFVGLNEHNQVFIGLPPQESGQSVTSRANIDVPAQISAPRPPSPAIVTVSSSADSIPTGTKQTRSAASVNSSTAVTISDAIQREITTSTIQFGQLLASVSPAPLASTPEAAPLSPADSGRPTEKPETRPAGKRPSPDSPTLLMTAEASTQTRARPESQSTSWDELVSYFSIPGNTPEQDSRASRESASSDKPGRPETLVRPALPPIQRVQPIQRAAILPPRIQPLRL